MPQFYSFLVHCGSPAAWTEKYRRDSDDIDNRYLQNLNRDPEFQVSCQTELVESCRGAVVLVKYNA
jgi:hypothetical protein